jgi:hypothetical protein
MPWYAVTIKMVGAFQPTSSFGTISGPISEEEGQEEMRSKCVRALLAMIFVQGPSFVLWHHWLRLIAFLIPRFHHPSKRLLHTDSFKHAICLIHALNCAVSLVFASASGLVLALALALTLIPRYY